MNKKFKRLWRQATADKKKFGILVTMAAVGLLLWGRLILLEDVPKIATADPEAQSQQGETASAEPAAQGVGSDTILPPLPSVHVAMGEDMTLNLFAFRHNRYKPLPSEQTGSNGVQFDEMTDDERRQELVDLARSLRLQSVIQGESPAIVINGEMLRVGDSIEGFELVSFDSRTARLTRGGLTFLFKMWSE